MASAPRLLLPDGPCLVAGFGQAVLVTPEGEIETPQAEVVPFAEIAR